MRRRWPLLLGHCAGKRRGNLDASEYLSDGRSNGLVNQLGVRKPHFPLRGMDIDIDTGRIEVQEEHEQRILPLGKKGAVPVADRVGHRAVLDRSAIHEEVLRRA